MLFVPRDALTVSPALQLTKHMLLVSALSPQLSSLLSPAHSGPFTGTQGTWGPKSCPRLILLAQRRGLPFCICPMEGWQGALSLRPHPACAMDFWMAVG